MPPLRLASSARRSRTNWHPPKLFREFEKVEPCEICPAEVRPGASGSNPISLSLLLTPGFGLPRDTVVPFARRRPNPQTALELTLNLYLTDAMPTPYDVAFRGRAVAAYEAGEGGYHHLAALFGIGYRTLQRWVAQYRATESVEPKPRGGWHSPIEVIVLHAVIRERPDGTCDEGSGKYNRRVGRDGRTNATSFRRAMKARVRP